METGIVVVTEGNRVYYVGDETNVARYRSCVSTRQDAEIRRFRNQNSEPEPERSR